MSLTFLRGQVAYMRAHGFDVHAVTCPGEELEAFGRDENVPVHGIPMTRRITPGQDIRAALGLWRLLRRVRPAIVHAHTPKAGLLAMISAAALGTPIRIYQMRGLPLATADGMRRNMLRGAEWLACALAHLVICNSHSLREVAVSEGIVRADKIRVLLQGSGNGVDASHRFDPARLDREARRKVRRELGIPDHAAVIGFIGRIVREKGIVELAEAWREIREDWPEAHLLLVGPFETRDPVPAQATFALQQDPRVHLIGEEWDTPPLYAAMDLIVLPTYREGFPNVPLEAAAMELPVVATRVPGCVDAVRNGETGLLVPARDPRALAEAIRTYLADPELRARHASAARERVLRDFRPEDIWEALRREYLDLLDGSRAAPATSRRGGRGASMLKRGMDVFGAAAGLLLLAPLLAVLGFLVRVWIGSPILFRQIRPGLHGRPFTIRKFRTMRAAWDEQGNPLPDEERLTRFGQFLRQTSLDELPELWNVLVGEMSLVGPRPLLIEYLPLYTPEQARRHEVRPGMTGWAQIHGRNDTTWEKRLALDTWYVDHHSLMLDLRILLRTLLKVIRREGISQRGVATMERFDGSIA